ncbi:deleted in malignant brain tumors 1 protein-like isoform X2 [Pomacea canaliculata]|uniref:deleted in malignant brain tumors 1 protein-like isoform X2 n=1 Tax=Pomacea canaliculata TaxID=400727 RepID=UPI000D73370A|nr:deleted in malignant brain tumors 1 protein-like isoform X2 [Pomacea canaliculata]
MSRIVFMMLLFVPGLAEEFRARLVNGTANAGRLEILYRGEWSTVCHDGFGIQEARVACRMLGFSSSRATVVASGAYGAGAGRILLDDVKCHGTENSLAECRHMTYYSSDCSHRRDVGVICYEAKHFVARIVNGSENSGRLEIFYDGEWSTVCDKGFGKKEATVACRMLGLNSTGATVVTISKYGEGAGRILLKEVKCQGTESSLPECDVSTFYPSDCSHSDDVAVACYEVSPGPARLANGDRKSGRLEIYHKGEWSTVCNIGFEDREARVACRMLGFNSSDSLVVETRRYGEGAGRILPHEVNCEGTESSLEECDLSNFHSSRCGHSKDVGLICNEVGPVTARLANGTHDGGRLEIFHNGKWSTVCAGFFGDKEARVACRMLGFNSSGGRVVHPRIYGAGAGEIILNDVYCKGTESSLVECYHNRLYHHNCRHSDHVGVTCDKFGPVTARLANGDRKAGRLEIFYNGKWSTVCNNGFGDKEARVACRMLGFNSSNARVDKAGVFRPWRKGKGRIAVSQVNCVGTESSVAECDYSSDTSSCFHEDDVRVICNEDSTDLKLTARLVNGDGMSGRLEIFHNGEWGTVCNDIFEDTEARVACRMLGLKSFGATVVDTSTYGQGAGTIIFNHVACRGTENSLEECEVSNFYSIGCRHSEDVGVICKEDSPVAARLADGDAEGGRLELFHNGEWKSVCSSRFGDKSALVACRMAGFNSSAIVAATSNAYGSGAGRIIFDYVKCRGTESSLLDCRYKKLDITECDHSDDIGVICKEVTKPTTKSVIKKDSSLPTTTSPTTTTTTEKITKVTTTTKSRTGNATAVTTSTTTTSTTTTVTLEP